jgi:hypothetical protein
LHQAVPWFAAATCKNLMPCGISSFYGALRVSRYRSNVPHDSTHSFGTCVPNTTTHDFSVLALTTNCCFYMPRRFSVLHSRQLSMALLTTYSPKGFYIFWINWPPAMLDRCANNQDKCATSFGQDVINILLEMSPCTTFYRQTSTIDRSLIKAAKPGRSYIPEILRHLFSIAPTININ